MGNQQKHKWTFQPRFRRGAFGWKTNPARTRVREAVSEIKKTARKDPLLGAEGAVLFLEKISPAIQNVDSSSGAIGIAVNKAIESLVPIIAHAPADSKTRTHWLQRLFAAYEADEIPYIEILAEYWGDLCASKEIASEWGDQLIEITRMSLSPDRSIGGFFHGSSACLSALFKAERYDEVIEIAGNPSSWSYSRWVVKALAMQGKKEEALAFAESSYNPWSDDRDVDLFLKLTETSRGASKATLRHERLLALRKNTYLAWYRAVAKAHPGHEPDVLLKELAQLTPGEEGKWFAATKNARLYHLAIELASKSPCDPKTLTRAAKDFREENPKFALEAGFIALHWLSLGYGYEITGIDIINACKYTLDAATILGVRESTHENIAKLAEGHQDSLFQRLVKDFTLNTPEHVQVSSKNPPKI